MESLRQPSQVAAPGERPTPREVVPGLAKSPRQVPAAAVAVPAQPLSKAAGTVTMVR